MRSLVTLQLDDLSVLWVLNDGAVAGKLLFQRLDDSLFVKLLRDSLNRGEGLASVPLLDSDVNESVAVHTPSHIVFVNIERVEVCKVLKLGHSKRWCGTTVRRENVKKSVYV